MLLQTCYHYNIICILQMLDFDIEYVQLLCNGIPNCGQVFLILAESILIRGGL